MTKVLSRFFHFRVVKCSDTDYTDYTVFALLSTVKSVFIEFFFYRIIGSYEECTKQKAPSISAKGARNAGFSAEPYTQGRTQPRDPVSLPSRHPGINHNPRHGPYERIFIFDKGGQAISIKREKSIHPNLPKAVPPQ